MMVTKGKKNRLGLGLCLAACLFLFNPNISIIDVLPDFIGYLLLCRGLFRLADLNESVRSAFGGFRKMIFIDAAKWVALVWVFGLSVTTERNSSLLLWSFVFAVLEMIMLLPSYFKLFEGLTQIGYLYQNRSLFGDGASSGKKSRTDRMRIFTMVFLIAKAVLSFLPELADLSNSSYDESSGLVNLYRYIGVMRMLAFLPALILGILWLVRILSYFRRILRDDELMEGLAARYESEVAPKEGMFICRNVGTVFVLSAVSFLLTFDLRLDYQNVLPDFLVAIALGVTFLLLKKNVKISNASWMFGCGAYFVLSALSFWLESSFFAEYTYGSIIRDESAMIHYYSLVGADVLKSLIFVFLLWTLIRALGELTVSHTGYVAGREQMGEREKKMIAALHRELKRGMIPAIVFGILYAISDVAYDILAVNYGFAGLMNFLCGALFLFFFLRGFSAIREAVNTKYMLS